MTARISFEHELEQLNEEVRQMSQYVEEAVEKVMIAFSAQDVTLAEEIIHGDRKINDIEKTIESRCLSLILRQQPVAKDLRIVTTALKVVTDLERIGDHAADISELIIRNGSTKLYEIAEPIPKLAKAAKQMVQGAVEAFLTNDMKQAEETVRMDDLVDGLFQEGKETIIILLKQSEVQADLCIDILMIAKYLERIGDHAVNLCEWTEFHETGTVNHVRIL